jgi:hypothetical protein
MKYIAKLISCFKADQFDPVRNCNVYKTLGCSHVDGFLCDMRTCGINHEVRITPTVIIDIDAALGRFPE